MTNLQISINISTLNSSCDYLNRCKFLKRSFFSLKFLQPTSLYSPSGTNIGCVLKNGFNLRDLEEKNCLLGEKNQILLRLERRIRRNDKRVVVVKANGGFGLSGSGGGRGGGGGGGDNNGTGKLLGNIAVVIGLAYLSVTDQLGWILDAIVSLWLLAIILPALGLGAFIWWAGQDMVQDSCPNCGNEFQIFKSSLKDGPQLCPYCSQPFSVKGNKFVQEPTIFSNQSTTYGQAFDGFSGKKGKTGKISSLPVVDVEAEVMDVD
ncbi:hypothetical protein MKX03_006923 [Papaver bracteatum]|nr:hypothetical protein MKX03_006923 [Papaver bracteatum]